MSLTNYPGGLSSFGMPVIPGGVAVPGNVYWCDPTRGSDTTGDGKSPSTAKASLAAAYALTTADQNDTVMFIGGATGDNTAAAINWANSYTHLIGLSSTLAGVGQRCRVVGSSTVDPAQVITFAGNGCIVRSMQFFNGADNAADNGAVIVTGSRCEFTNVMFAGMGTAVASSASTRAGGYSLKVSGGENLFQECQIGLDTILRTAANSELILSGERNRFRSCDFVSQSATAGKFLVNLVTDADTRVSHFEDCLFYNNSSNWGTQINNAFTITGGGSTYYVDLSRCRLVGPVGWGDVVTHIYTSDPQPNAGAGVATNPTT